MSIKSETMPESYKTTFEISPQLNLLIKQMGIYNMRNVVDPSISNEELDELLNKITLEGSKKRYLIEIVNVIVSREGVSDRDELINLKIKVLLDNLSKKMCKCVAKTKNIGLCRSSIFKKRNLDFITYDCGDSEKNELSYDYRLGPLLKPSVSGNPIILRRPINIDDTTKSSSASLKPSQPTIKVMEKQTDLKSENVLETIDYSISDDEPEHAKSDILAAQIKLYDMQSKSMNPLDIDCSKFDKYSCRRPCKWNGSSCYK